MSQIPVLASATFNITSNSLLSLSQIFKGLFRPSRPRKEKLTDRIAHVSSIRISPEKFVAYQEDTLQFSALPSDYAGRTLQGVGFEWESLDYDKASIDQTGLATFLQPGLARIRCRAGVAEAEATILVRPGKRPIQSDEEWHRDQADGPRIGSNTTIAPQLLSALMDKITPTAYAQGCQHNLISDSAFDELWSDPANQVGSPRHRAIEPTRLGTVLPESSNFNIAIPLVNLGGRGIGTNLTLYYNSRVWARKNNSVYYDALEGWPGPGFSLGFGRIVAYGSGKYMLIEPDGTRRYLGTGSGSGFTLRTTDGSNITYENFNQNGGRLRYQDGTQLYISNINNRLLPSSIMDRNGNIILIAYKSPDESEAQYSPLAIDYITDTLGRIIEFNYDSQGKLVSIDAPAIGGTSQNPLTRKVVDFEYQSLAITTNFSGLSFVAPPPYAPICVPKRVSFPDTQSGYLFTYSSYGMIYKFSLRKGVYYDLHPPGYNDSGERASVTLNYPTSNATQLTNAPVFTQRTEAALDSPTAVYSYAATTDTLAQTKTFKITRPDSSELWLTRSTNTTSPANGLLVQTEVRSSSASFSKSTMSYTTDSGGSPQVQSVISYDDAGVPTKVDFDYDQYGNVTNKREYGHQISGTWQVRRRTRYTYKTDSAYVNNYLRSLVTLTEVFDAQQNTNDADDLLIAKTAYVYDDYMVMGGMENYGYTSSTPWPPHHSPSFNTGNTVRGNVTGTSQWSDIAANASITRNVKYDIFGNVVKAQVSCCQEKSFIRDETTCWGMPEEVMSGDPNGLHLTETRDTDFNTGLVTSQTDVDNQTTSTEYDAAHRVEQIITPTGASNEIDYYDSSLSYSSTITYEDGLSTITLTTSAQYDGWGQMIKYIGESGREVRTTYNAIGQVVGVTLPFQTGSQPGVGTSYEYDALGRRKRTIHPDSNVSQTLYNGSEVTSVDEVNRQKKTITDGLGRLVSVVEQDNAGLLNQATTYSYDLLDRLVQVNQGGQIRAYKYDVLGRLLYERIPEQAATINDGTGTMWSCKYTYTSFDAVATRTDARGVVTTYSYDTLHRLTGKSYNTSNAPGVPATPSEVYSYNGANLSSVTIGAGGTFGGYTEEFFYDAFGRLKEDRKIINVWYPIFYQYNEAGQQKRVEYPNGKKLNTSYDNLGRFVTLKDDQGVEYLKNIQYNLIGQVTSVTRANAATETYTYDPLRLQLSGQTATKNGTTLMSLSYGYQSQSGQLGAQTTAGNAGQLVSISGQIAGQTESASYTYDNVERLISSTQTSNGLQAQRKFAYDRWGNRTTVWDSINPPANQPPIQTISMNQQAGVPTNRIASVTTGAITANYTYDNSGNVVSDGQHSYEYDAENRLVKVDAGATAQYSYDHLNRRYKEIVGGVTTKYLWEGRQVVQEYLGASGSPAVQYINSKGKLIAKISSGVTRHILSDRLSARVILDTSGNVVGHQRHLPFGEEWGLSGEQDKHYFTSYEREQETGLDYAVNRGYSSDSGRFQQADSYRWSSSLLHPQTWNRYSYVINDPINKVDPSGLDWEPSGDGCFWDPDTATLWCPFADEGDPNQKPIIDGGTNPLPGTWDPIPEPEPEDKEKWKRIIDDIVNQALEALKNDKCKDVVRGDISRENIEMWLKNLNDRGRIQTGRGGGIARTWHYTDTDPARTELYNSFFIADRSAWGGSGEGTTFPSGLEKKVWQTMVILHELGHATRAYGMDNEAETNRDIWNNCLKPPPKKKKR